MKRDYEKGEAESERGKKVRRERLGREWEVNM